MSAFEFDETRSHRLRTSAFNATVGPDDAMCGHEQINRRRRHRGGNAAMGERPPDGARDFRIRYELAER
jgi:hypothetical protein